MNLDNQFPFHASITANFVSILSKEGVKLCLHWISREAELEVIACPILLLATHWYCDPLSAWFTFVIVNSFLFAEKVILGLALVFTGDPSLFHENVGTGFPLASQEKVTLSPAVFVAFCG